MNGSPPLPRVLRALLGAVLGPAALERALGDLEDTCDRIRRTRGPAAARRACVREALLIMVWSGAHRIRSVVRHEGHRARDRRPSMVGDFVQDVRRGARALLRQPAFAAVVVGVLGLGVGANVAIFTIADRLFLRAPPLVEAPDGLVRVFRAWGVPDVGGSLSYPDYLDYRNGTATLRGLAAYASSPTVVTARTGDATASASALAITANYFDVLGIEPVAGRFFVAEENRTVGTHPVAIVSWGFWHDRLGGAADVAGREVALNGETFTIVGVVPRGFRGLGPADAVPDVYIPILMRDAIAPSNHTAWRERVAGMRDRWLSAVGRLEAGATVEATQQELALIAQRIRELEDGDPQETVLVTPEFRWLPSTGARLAGLTRVLLVAVGMLLACATANVAILLLARATTREREMGIRSALGAGRGRVARQLFAESVLLGGAGCLAGVAVALLAARVTAALLPVSLDVPLVPDARMLAAALATALLTALLVGIAPVRHATRADVLGAIQGRDRRAGGSRARDVLVVLQVALSLVLVAGAALFARSLVAARSVDLGFEPAGVLLVGVNLGNHGYDAERGRAFLVEALERLRALPSVEAATATRQVPFRGDWTTDLEPWPGSSFTGDRDLLTAGMNLVAPDYFAVMRIPILRGRALDAQDRDDAATAIVVNEAFAEMAWADGEALGRTVPLGSREARIVGIARDAKYYELSEARWPQIYGSALQLSALSVGFAVRTAGAPLALSPAVQRALHAIDPAVAFTRIETLEAVHAEQLARYRATAHVVGLTGLIALLLASAGLYGVMAYRVSERTREIGLRMALGASRRSLARALLLRGLRLSIVGIALGTAAALVLGRLVEASLFGVPARDPTTLAVAPLVLLAVALAALWVPARRAMDVDPMRAMRSD